MYWGPLPALLLAATKVLFGIPTSVSIGDQYPALVFAALTFIFLALLVDELGRRLFSAPLWLSASAVLVVAYASPLPFMLARGAVYEVAILGGQAFLMAGLLIAATTLLASEAVLERAGPRWVLVGACWAAAIACRLSLAPAVALLIAATVLAGTPRPWALRRSSRLLVQLATPVVLGVGMLLVYNRARFGSLLDFGVSKMLTFIPFKTSVEYIVPNLYSYFWRPFESLCHFPFMQSVSRLDDTFPAGFQLPEGYRVMIIEAVIGLLRTTPWLVFAVYALWDFARRLAALRSREVRAALDQGARVRLWTAFCSLAMVALGLAPVLVMFIATMRYFADFRQGLLLLGALGAFTLYERVRERGPLLRYGVNTVIALCAAYTIATGALIGFDSYYRQFASRNPELYQSLAKSMSFCPEAKP
jgi:hypothetical protein